MKNIIELEFNGKKTSPLGRATVDTPGEFMLVEETTEAILNSRVLQEFMDDMFVLTVEEAQRDFAEKIDNTYVTFISSNDEIICSLILDKMKPKKGTYRARVTDWQSSGYVFKYVEAL